MEAPGKGRRGSSREEEAGVHFCRVSGFRGGRPATRAAPRVCCTEGGGHERAPAGNAKRAVGCPLGQQVRPPG